MNDSSPIAASAPDGITREPVFQSCFGLTSSVPAAADTDTSSGKSRAQPLPGMRAVLRLDEHVRAGEIQPARIDDAFMGRAAVDAEAGPDILLVDFEHDFRRIERRAAPPFAHDTGVAGPRWYRSASSALPNSRVSLVEASRRGSSPSAAQAIGDEAFAGDVELADLDGVGAVETTG